MDKTKIIKTVFHLENIKTNQPLTVVVKRGMKDVKFLVNSILTKRHTEELDKMFILFNQYCLYKDEHWNEILFDRVYATYRYMSDRYREKEDRAFFALISSILELIDLDDVEYFLYNVKNIQIPSVLEEEFNDEDEKDGVMTRVQTYTRNNYKELSVIVLMLKPIIGPLFAYAGIKYKDQKELSLLDMMSEHPYFKAEAVKKIEGVIWRLKEVNASTAQKAMDTKMIELITSEREILQDILGFTIFHKLSIEPLILNNDGKHIVAKNYIFIKNKLKPVNDVSKKLNNKPTGGGSEDADKESVFESHRTDSAVTIGEIEEQNFAVHSVEFIIEQLKRMNHDYMYNYIEQKYLKDNLVPSNIRVHDAQIKLLGFVFKDIISPKGMPYIRHENIVNMLHVAFLYAHGLGFKDLALLFLKEQKLDDIEVFESISNSVVIAPLSKDLENELYNIFPLTKADGKKEVYAIKETMKKLCKNIADVQWNNHHIPDEILNDANDDVRQIQNRMAEFVLKHENNRISNHVT